MKIKNKFRIIFIIILSVGVLGIGYYFLFSKPDKAGNTVVDNAFGWKFPVAKFPITGAGNLAYSNIRNSGGIPQGLPVRLQIPIIGVDSAIEDALITPDGRMDVPAGSVNVAWFALGPHPGQVGSAVIGGHFGIKNGVPFVFYKLDLLKIGDKVYIIDDNGNTLTFQVKSIKLFDRNADATTVFTSLDGLAHLNLITCEGIWNKINGNYPQRRVVFADAIPNESTVPVSVISNKTLRMGSYGADVVTLQTGLLQKGFFGTTSKVIDGSFGKLTSIAVAKYQTSIGLSPDGVFGPLSRAKFTTLKDNPIFPNTGIDKITTSININNSPTILQTIIQFIKSLYETPLDGLITTSLLISIILMLFKIIKK